MPTNAVNKVQGGQMLHIKLQETIFHPGHYRVALAVNSRSELPPDPDVKTRDTDKGPWSVSSPSRASLKSLCWRMACSSIPPAKPAPLKRTSSYRTFIARNDFADCRIYGRTRLQSRRRIFLPPLRGFANHTRSGESYGHPLAGSPMNRAREQAGCGHSLTVVVLNR